MSIPLFSSYLVVLEISISSRMMNQISSELNIISMPTLVVFNEISLKKRL